MPERPLPAPRRRPSRAAALLLLAALAATACSRERNGAIRDLASPSAEVRADALGRLQKASDDEEIAALLRAAEDPAAIVRIAAAAALGTAVHPRAVDALVDLLGDPSPEVQTAAAQGLAASSSARATRHLLASFPRRGAHARRAIAEALATRGTGAAEVIGAEARAIWERNLAALESGSIAERVGAAEELGRSGRKEAIERLQELVHDRSVLLASAAARGLAATGEPGAREHIEPLLAEDFPQLREAAAEALGKLGDPAAGPALAKVAVLASQGAVSAALALGRLPGTGALACEAAVHAALPGAVQLLARHAVAEGASCDTSALTARIAAGGGDAATALEAAAGLRASDALPAAGRIAADERAAPALRAAAIHVLGAAGGEPERARLGELLGQLSSLYLDGVQDWAREPLPLAFAAGFEPSAEAAQGAEIAARAGVTAAAATFELVEDVAPGTPALLAATARAAGRLQVKGTAAILVSLAPAPDREVRAAAVEGLASLPGTDTAATLVERALHDEADEVRVAAVESLAAQKRADSLAYLVAHSAGITRDTALRCSASAGDRAAGPAALASFRREPSPEAAGAIGALRPDGASEVLVSALATEAASGRVQTIDALALLGDEGAGKALEPALFHDRPEVRAAAARALGALRHQDSRKILEALAAQDYYLEVRRAAADALKALGKR